MIVKQTAHYTVSMEDLQYVLRNTSGEILATNADLDQLLESYAVTIESQLIDGSKALKKLETLIVDMELELGLPDKRLALKNMRSLVTEIETKLKTLVADFDVYSPLSSQKRTTQLQYSEEDAIKWCITHFPTGVKVALRSSVFEAEAKKQKLPFVTVTEEITAVISRKAIDGLLSDEVLF